MRPYMLWLTGIYGGAWMGLPGPAARRVMFVEDWIIRSSEMRRLCAAYPRLWLEPRKDALSRRVRRYTSSGSQYPVIEQLAMRRPARAAVQGER